MRLLLDTHALLSFIDEGSKTLAPTFRRALEAPDAQVHVSVASLWEIAIKWRLNKLPLARSPETIPAMVVGSGLSILSITAEHALASVEPDPPTRDPFDRLLLAQCKVEGLKLLTTDRALASHPLALQLP